MFCGLRAPGARPDKSAQVEFIKETSRSKRSRRLPAIAFTLMMSRQNKPDLPYVRIALDKAGNAHRRLAPFLLNNQT